MSDGGNADLDADSRLDGPNAGETLSPRSLGRTLSNFPSGPRGSIRSTTPKFVLRENTAYQFDANPSLQNGQLPFAGQGKTSDTASRQSLEIDPDINFLNSYGIGNPTLLDAMQYANQFGVTAVSALILSGAISYSDYMRCLADFLNLEYFDQDHQMQDFQLTAGSLKPEFLANNPRFVFARRRAEKLTLFLVPDIKRIVCFRAQIEKWPLNDRRLVLADPHMLRRWIIEGCEDDLAESAQSGLKRFQPEFSASRVVTRSQTISLAVALSVFAALLLAIPNLTWWGMHILFSALFFSCVALRIWALTFHIYTSRKPAAVTNIFDGDRPVYSVLVALYDEANQVPDLVAAMENLQWPRHRLEIKFVVEYKDRTTRNALTSEIRRRRCADIAEVLVVPPGDVQTKPRALNFALPLTRGEFVVLFDAEDRPHPLQLEEAWQAFENGPEELGCLQAPLEIRNARTSWLSMMFGIEYQALFNGVLPGLAALNLSFPLGGTSNHFKRTALQNCGGWDAHNVTEDADLGMRLARKGYKSATLKYPTLEEAPVSFNIWLKQRTRWFKGWMQTWLVHLRNPIKLVQEAGAINAFVFGVLFFGVIVSALVHPLLYVVMGYGVYSMLTGAVFFEPILILDMFNVIAAFLCHIVLGFRCSKGSRIDAPANWPLLLPLYWSLSALAAWRAFFQLFTQPFLWEKTPHGQMADGNLIA